MERPAAASRRIGNSASTYRSVFDSSPERAAPAPNPVTSGRGPMTPGTPGTNTLNTGSGT
jgi:hypothetical protein